MVSLIGDVVAEETCLLLLASEKVNGKVKILRHAEYESARRD